MTTCRVLLLAATLLLAPSIALGQGATPFSGLLGGSGAPGGGAPGAAPANGTAAAAAECQGKTPAKLVVESAVPVPAQGQQPSIVIRNIGGQDANLTNYQLAASGAEGNATANSPNALTIAKDRACRENATLAAGAAVVWKPKGDGNVCGFPFQLNASGSVTLFDASGNPVSSLAWRDMPAGGQAHLSEDDTTAISVPPGNVIDVLNSLGEFSTFVQLLQATNNEKALSAASDPNYTGPQLADNLPDVSLQLPWWFTQGLPAAASPPPAQAAAPAAPPPVGVPAAGPYTIFAPTDSAIDALLTTLGNGRPVPREALFRLPELANIIQYHIVPGRYTTEYFRNNTPIYTAKGVEIVPFVDGCMTEGKIMLHDSCIDKPTADNYTCVEQKAFQKCDFPFMTSALAAQWQGGFCQRTCQRCSCAADSGVSCATVVLPDVYANNGVIHGISRVLFPPPLFTKDQAIQQAIAYNQSVAANQSAGLPVSAPLPGGAVALPGATPGAATTGAAPGATPTVPTPPAATDNSSTASTGAADNSTNEAATAGSPPASSPAASSPPASPPAAQTGRKLLQLFF